VIRLKPTVRTPELDRWCSRSVIEKVTRGCDSARAYSPVAADDLIGHHGLRSAHTEIEPAARRPSQQGGLLGDMYRCIKRQYPATAVPTWRMLVSPSR
jgi:hypothetical protein